MGKQIDKKTFMLAIAVAAKHGKTLVDVAAELKVEFSTVYQRWNGMRKELVEKFEEAGKDVSLIPTIPSGKPRGRPTAGETLDMAMDIFGGDALNDIDTGDVIPTASAEEYAKAGGVEDVV